MNAGSSRMDSYLTGMWVNFFTAAGIPPDVAATYALTFSENRIQTDMLLDLNKEYLRDMGITRMGDVIAILRHAKQVHESTARDRVLGIAVSTKVPVAAVTGRATVSQQPSSPARRILERCTRNAVQEPSPVLAAQQKRKLVDTGANTEANIKRTRLIRFGTTTETAVNEDSTNKHTVFSRLGGNTEAIKSVAVTNTNPNTVSMGKTVTIKPEVKTIFSRLGAKAKAVADDAQVIPIQKDALKYEGILKGAPVINKMVTVTTTRNNVRRILGCTTKSQEQPVVVKDKVLSGCTMRADETPVSIKEKLSMPKAKSVKFSNCVEYKEIETRKVPIVVNQKFTPVFNKPERRLSMPVTAATVPAATDNSVKTRLGVNNTLNLTITKNVFNRLGV